MNRIEKGSTISARHIKSGEIMNYKVLVEREKEDLFRLLNMKTLFIMSGFKARNPKKVLDYIEKI